MNYEKNLGRNDKCWCGSGKKFKHCHLGRDKQKEMSVGELIQRNAKQKSPKRCFHDSVDKLNCSKKIINAHTVSKGSSLSKIAMQGKVYHFKPDLAKLFKNNGKFELELLGINQASTFSGFCSYHDRELFSPIENKDFSISSYNCFLLGYRALVKEMYAKDLQHSGIEIKKDLDKGKPLSFQVFYQRYLNNYEKNVNFAQKDLLILKNGYDKVFLNGNHDNIYYFVMRFDNIPNILFSGSFFPEFDFDGNMLQIFGREDSLDAMTVNMIVTKVGGLLSFQWIGKSKANEQFIASLKEIEHENLASSIIQFAFEVFENLYVSPNWWDNLDEEMKISLENKIYNGIPTNPHKSNHLLPDGYIYDKWENIVFYTNLE